MKHTAKRTISQQAIIGHINRAIELECQLVVCGWSDPAGLYKNALEHGLGAKRLADPLSGFLFAYLCACHEHGRKPDWDEASYVAETYCDTTISAWEILTLLNTTDYEAAELDTYAFGVALLANRREKARYHYSRYQELTADDNRSRPRLTGRVVA